MLQNHMLQVLALIAMEAPCKMDAKEIRKKKQRFFLPPDLEINWSLVSMRYRQEQGVGSDSMTQTFVAGDLYIDNWRWGCSFYFYDW